MSSDHYFLAHDGPYMIAIDPRFEKGIKMARVDNKPSIRLSTDVPDDSAERKARDKSGAVLDELQEYRKIHRSLMILREVVDQRVELEIHIIPKDYYQSQQWKGDTLPLDAILGPDAADVLDGQIGTYRNSVVEASKRYAAALAEEAAATAAQAETETGLKVAV